MILRRFFSYQLQVFSDQTKNKRNVLTQVNTAEWGSVSFSRYRITPSEMVTSSSIHAPD